MLPIVVAPIVVAVCVGVTKLARAKGCKEEQKQMRWFQ